MIGLSRNLAGLKRNWVLSKNERSLEVKAEVLAQLFIHWIKTSDSVQMSLGSLELWRGQAEAIERAPAHVCKIDQIFIQARERAAKHKGALLTVEIPVRD